jgi:lipopolysaccharide export system protein LptC
MLPSRSGSIFRSTLSTVLVLLVCVSGVIAAEKIKRGPKPKPSVSTNDLTEIPLPIGHEAKGLVLPSFDPDGHLVGRLEAQSAKRTDKEHVLFTALKLTTFTDANAPDLLVEMSDSVLDLKTRIVTSDHRATIKRADFHIAGDSLQFDTNSRQGTLVGNVKMVITGSDRLVRQNETANE